MVAQRTYLAIDLKSFYASVECVRPPSGPPDHQSGGGGRLPHRKDHLPCGVALLKAYKIPGRARLFEAVQRVRDVNTQRLQTASGRIRQSGERTASTTLPAPLSMPPP